MPEVKVNLFADYQTRADFWSCENVAAGMKIKGIGKQQAKVAPWLQKHSFSAAMENMHQRVFPRPRRVFLCKNCLLSNGHKKEAENILEVARTGGDLDQYLGNNIRKLGAADALLNFWRIFHFHLSPFGQRETGKDNVLLFAYITNDAFYAIKIGTHEDLKKTAFLVKTLQNEFPEAISGYRVNEDAAVDIDSEEYCNLCAMNINAVVSVNGISYRSPGGGVLSNGNSAESYCETIAIHSRLDCASQNLERGFLIGLEKLSNGYVERISAKSIHLKLVGFPGDEILLYCPELGLTISYRDKTGEMAVVGENAPVV